MCPFSYSDPSGRFRGLLLVSGAHFRSQTRVGQLTTVRRNSLGYPASEGLWHFTEYWFFFITYHRKRPRMLALGLDVLENKTLLLSPSRRWVSFVRNDFVLVICFSFPLRFVNTQACQRCSNSLIRVLPKRRIPKVQRTETNHCPDS